MDDDNAGREVLIRPAPGGRAESAYRVLKTRSDALSHL